MTVSKLSSFNHTEQLDFLEKKLSTPLDEKVDQFSERISQSSPSEKKTLLTHYSLTFYTSTKLWNFLSSILSTFSLSPTKKIVQIEFPPFKHSFVNHFIQPETSPLQVEKFTTKENLESEVSTSSSHTICCSYGL